MNGIQEDRFGPGWAGGVGPRGRGGFGFGPGAGERGPRGPHGPHGEHGERGGREGGGPGFGPGFGFGFGPGEPGSGPGFGPGFGAGGPRRGFGPRGGRGFGPRGPWAGRGFGPREPWGGRGADGEPADLPDAGDAAAWFAGRLPDGWFVGAPGVEVDDDEILVVGELAAPAVAEGSTENAAAAADGRASRFREDTRRERIGIARQAQERYGRTVSWGVKISGTEFLYTHVQARGVVPLSRDQRRRIDQLVASEAAETRSDALAKAIDFGLAHSADWSPTPGGPGTTDGSGSSKDAVTTE